MIRSNQGNEWMYGKVLKYTQLFDFLWATHFEKRTLKTEISEIKHFKLLSKENNGQFA